MNKDKKIRHITGGSYLINALNSYESRPGADYTYDHDFEIHLPGYVLTVLDGELNINPTTDNIIQFEKAH